MISKMYILEDAVAHLFMRSEGWQVHEYEIQQEW